MPRETYLPAGMEGVIVCPVQADPPVLYVNWTKDGNDLNLDKVVVGHGNHGVEILPKLHGYLGITVCIFSSFYLSSSQVGW